MDQDRSRWGEQDGEGHYRLNHNFKPSSSGFLAGEIIIFILNIGGLFLNLLVFYILVIRIRILKVDTVLSVLATIFDFIASATMIARLIAKWVILSAGSYKNFPMLCKPTGILFFASTISAFDVVAVLGLIRCLIIVFNFRMKSVYWGIILSILIIFNWAGASVMEWNLPEISWNGFCQVGFHRGSGRPRDGSNSRQRDGYPRSDQPGHIDVFGEIESIKSIILLIVIIISYALIFRFYRKYYENVKRSSSTDQHLIKEIGTQKNKTSLKLLLLIFSYVIIYIPKFAIFILYNFTKTKPDPNFEMVSAVLYTMSPIVNASVLLFIQEETKQELQLLWTLIFHRARTALK
ncbi:hypothetical protein CONCODRAFT_13235 [Conidiobolus coronatus NRRL 28638]|uniref:G-protein coupled receptors family 1 profile domain-containing protein n=1 Tax=Conidiobolus coronatus (strain ATCC 28846 / CBS 209.66 / NRRL 28638) TaxID=796925 RepID=A0A137NR97_CONC2|nr:hypothetical protein CONCODRAFT_13235 [Conidiobolus coronatus NRRL 28638]|eukprot:KXN65244.1 hypothetical protein CONCODRAFT_13235 [Conidiobolus coronatus NRRL 28638]